MKFILSIIMIATMLFTGCYKGDGQVRIESNVKNATIYIDGNKIGMTGDEPIIITIKKGNHQVRIYKEINDEWYYESKQNFYVGENSPGYVKIDTDKKPTELRVKRLAKEELLEKEKEVYATAMATLEEARAGNVDSMKLIARYYESGYGVKTNIKKAKHWNEKVDLLVKENLLVKEEVAYATATTTLKEARVGNVDSMKLMVEYYENGYGVKANSKKALYWKKKVNQLVREKQDEEDRLAREKLAKRLKIVKESGFFSYPVDTYIDTDTKLMWQDNKDAKSVNVDWNGAKDYCQNLRIDEYSDWKLPSYLELLSIFTYKKDKYTIKEGFNNVAFMNYWSSSENVNSKTFAWHVDFREGEAIISSKSIKHYVRCVRGAVASPVFKMTD